MIDNKLPLTVVAGYLGAGKTTLINRLLSEDHGMRLCVMVNDFGAINIDADLLLSADKDTLTLTNGCVCCTMGADLYMAIGDVLDRRPRPDHLVIEASGIADPIKIANAARAEPELAYGGILTVVDGHTMDALVSDPHIGAQVAGQIAAADILAISKVTKDEFSTTAQANVNGPSVFLNEMNEVSPLLVTPRFAAPFKKTEFRHPTYVSRTYEGKLGMTEQDLRDRIAARPKGIFRVKGHVIGDQDQGWLVQVVGSNVEISAIPKIAETRIVAIGLDAVVSSPDFDNWWQAFELGAPSQS